MLEVGSTGKVEVGASDDELRLWTAREAVRHGELILAAQMQNLEAAETRASTFIGWMTAILAAIGASAGSSTSISHIRAAECAAFFGVLAVAFCVRALWPKRWHSAGYLPESILQGSVADEPTPSELENLETFASGYDDSIKANYIHLEKMAANMKVAYLSIGLALASSLTIIFYFHDL